MVLRRGSLKFFNVKCQINMSHRLKKITEFSTISSQIGPFADDNFSLIRQMIMKFCQNLKGVDYRFLSAVSCVFFKGTKGARILYLWGHKLSSGRRGTSAFKVVLVALWCFIALRIWLWNFKQFCSLLTEGFHIDFVWSYIDFKSYICSKTPTLDTNPCDGRYTRLKP